MDKATGGVDSNISQMNRRLGSMPFVKIYIGNIGIYPVKKCIKNSNIH